MKEKANILMITHGLGLEGAPRSFVIVAKGLTASGLGRVTVFSHVDGPLRNELEAAGIRVIVAPRPEVVEELPVSSTDLERYCRENMRFLDLSSGTAWKTSLESVAGYIRSHLGELPDVIITNTILGFWGVALAQLWHVPSVWCIHESETPFSHLSWLPRESFDMLPGLLRDTSRVVFAAEMTKKVFTQAGHTFAGTVIPYGLPADMPVFAAGQLDRRQARSSLGIMDENICFLALGSVFERKGQLDICQSMALLPADLLSNVRCHIVGDRPGTPYSNVLHSYINSLPDQTRRTIRVFPETQDTAPHYRAADVFVMCSRMESYPFVILEAMSQSLPIVTTPVYGIREQLDEQAALFYDPGDIQKLAAHLVRLAESSAERINLGREAYRRFTELPTHADMVSAYVKEIADLIDGHQKRKHE